MSVAIFVQGFLNEIHAFGDSFAVLAVNCADSQISHIHSCNTFAEVWAKLCNIHEAKSLANILFVRPKFFIIKIENEGDMLAHMNEVKVFADQLNRANVTIRDNDIFIQLLESLLPFSKYLIVDMETRPIQELTLIT